jgi:hypothetical protein
MTPLAPLAQYLHKWELGNTYAQAGECLTVWWNYVEKLTVLSARVVDVNEKHYGKLHFSITAWNAASSKHAPVRASDQDCLTMMKHWGLPSDLSGEVDPQHTDPPTRIARHFFYIDQDTPQ